jgi:CubicO group peptidase (beta-lactamase class C family)
MRRWTEPRLMLSVALAVLASSALEAQERPSPLAGLDEYIESVRRSWGIPGLAVGIVKDDSLVYARGFGVREVGEPDRVDENTVFAIGSNTKSFTSLAAAMLVDEEKLGWDDKVVDRYPGFRLFDPYVTREINIRDILSHRSGLGRRGDALWYGTDYSRDEVIRRIRYLEPNAPFRTEMGYQNIMFLTAGEIVGKVSGLGWDRFIQERIFRPLGMTRSTTSVKALPRQDNVSTPHIIADGAGKPIPWRDIDNIAPAGSINSSVVDMARYVRLHLGDGKLGDVQLVSSGNLGVTKTPHINVGSVGDSLTHFTSYGLGWVLLDYRGRKIAWHNGGIDGMLSEMWTVPDESLGVLVLTNGSPHGGGPPIVKAIIDRYLIGEPAKDYNAEALAQQKRFLEAQAANRAKRDSAHVLGTRPSLALSAYVGTYADRMYGDVTVVADGSSLALTYQSFRIPLDHWHFDTFMASVPPGSPFEDTTVTFYLDASAKVTSLEVADLATFTRRE